MGQAHVVISHLELHIFERGALVGMHAHKHTYAHYVDFAKTIAIVFAFE